MASSPKTPEEFRECAARCERLADESTVAATREILLYLAARWNAMAAADEARQAGPERLQPPSRLSK
jgi:hypothetical protein